jgi:hypothetical protein
VPEVVGARPAEDGSNLPSRLSQAEPQVVVFASPTDEVLVISIDRLVVGPIDTNIAAKHPRLGRMAEQVVESRLAIEASEFLKFASRGEFLERSRANGRDVNFSGRLFVERHAESCVYDTGSTTVQMLPQVVGRDQTVAVQKE